MSSIKVPIIVGLVGFLLIFVINLLIGNSLFIVISRALIYGILVSGILLGITFVFKNYLGIDLEFNETNQEKNDSNVDIMVGEEKVTVNEEENELVYMDNEIKSDDNEEIEEMSTIEEIKDESAELNLEEESKKESHNKSLNDPNENEVLFNSNDNEGNVSDDHNVAENSGSEDIDRLDVLSFDDEKPTNDYVASNEEPEITSDLIKERIGVDVSFEDVAKAIRTKLKSDE